MHLIYGTKNQNVKFLWLDKFFVSYYFALFMTSKTKTASSYDLIRPLFLVLVYGFNLQQGTFL